MGYFLEGHRILEKFPIAGIQNGLFKMRKIYKIIFKILNNFLKTVIV